jgi:superfamily I DNA/RNA helicase
MNNIYSVFGAPGCGKTTRLIELISELLKDYSPNKISFVSFTRKGTYEGRNRAMKEFGFKEEEDLPFFRTIHSLAFRNTEDKGCEIITRKHYKNFSDKVGMNFTGYYTEELINNDDKYLAFYNLYRNNKKEAKKVLNDLNYQTIKFVYNSYEKYKHDNYLKDYDDKIVDFIKQNKPLPVDVAIIDEAQDLTTLQWEFCFVAFRNCEKVYIAGDDDQAIHEWKGADTQLFLNLTKKGQIEILDQSYRLRKSILDYSKRITHKIKNRVEKNFEPIDQGGNIFFHNSLKEVTINNEESYYFLSRNHIFLSEFRNRLIENGLIFNYKGKSSIDKTLYNTIILYEKCRKENPDKIRGLSSIKSRIKPNIKWSKNLPLWYDALELTMEENKYYRALFRDKTDITKSNCTVSTIHGVKGGEADNVIIKLDITKNVYNNLIDVNGYYAELRCLYVALTRTKKNLHIIYSQSRNGYDEIIKSINN